MGACGFGHFENDAAMDWLWDSQRQGIKAIRAALERAANGEESLLVNPACEALRPQPWSARLGSRGRRVCPKRLQSG